MKRTFWTQLKIEDCQILEDYGDSLKIKHPALKRARYFVKSKNDNFYSRYTGKEFEDATGYIII